MDSFIIYLRFLTLCGLSEDDGEKYRFLCRDAVRFFKSRAISSSVLCEYGDSFNAAAAALAALNFERLNAGGNADSFRAGDVTVNIDGKAPLDGARAYYNAQLEAVKPYLKDCDFLFEAV